MMTDDLYQLFACQVYPFQGLGFREGFRSLVQATVTEQACMAHVPQLKLRSPKA